MFRTVPRGHRGRRIASDRRGATALEFALVMVPFLTLVLGVMEVGYDLYVQAVLDNAVQTAARSVQVGSVKGTSGETSAQFVTSAVCPAIGGRLDCSLLIVGVKTIPSGSNYYNDPSPPLSLTDPLKPGGGICTGHGGQLLVLQAWYAGPTFVGSLIPAFASAYGGGLVHLTTASVGFMNEYFAGGQPSGGGC